ncbi:MAG TPA: DUSAM domain-containing protein [Archangium sp.]|uniref:DUSAM domain-containing protein n=1 Tax=Archangium sp. TaxID=1872627 RepID=UPI002ED8BC4C
MSLESRDWHQVQELAKSAQRDGALALTDEVRDLLRRVAREVAVSDGEAEQALRFSASAMDLAIEVSRRIREGSRRLSRAIVDANRLHASGNLLGARRLLEELLAQEVVPLYREIARNEWDELGL